MITKQHTLALAFFGATLFAALPASAAMSSHDYDVAKTKIESDYKVDKAKCDGLKDNAKDVCEEEAKAREKLAKAELKQQHEPSDSHRHDVDKARAEGQYDVAKERCEDQKGDAEDACKKKAKADYEAAKSQIK